MTKFNLALIKIRIKQTARWIMIIGTGIILGITLILAGLFLASLKDSSLKSLRFQSPFQPIIRIEVQEQTLKAPVKPKIASQKVETAKAESNTANDLKAN